MDSAVDQDSVPLKKRRNYGMKRKNSTGSAPKKPKLEETGKSEITLALLPEDVLLEIFKNCDHHTLAQLRLTHPNFERLVQDFSLWREVNFTLEPVQWADLYFIYENINKNTKVLQVLGNQTNVLPSNWIRQVLQKSPHLELISFHKQVLDAGTFSISMLPETLTSLDLSKASFLRLPIEQSYFKDISKCLPNLKRLNLSNCLWFEPHSLMAISKCLKLEVLELADCQQVRDCLAYCGLSTRSGFPALVTLDLRRCAISNSELVCFTSIKSLKNLYLENPWGSTVIIDSALIMMCGFEQSPINGEIVQRLSLERLTVRHYKLKFATFLTLANVATTLKFIDVTGSGLTSMAIERFRYIRPDVTLVVDNENQSV